MLTITINVETAQEAREQLRELLGLDRETAAPEQPDAQEKPKATRGKSKPAASAPEATTADTAAEAAGSTQSQTSAPAAAEGATSTATTDAGGAVTKQDLAEKATAYGQKAGPDALKQLFVEAGSANGKFSEVPPEKYGALAARLDDLIAG